jgi:hypothetical protein
MLSPLDQLLVFGPLRRRQLRVDLRAHARLDGIEARPHLRPQGVGLGAVAGENGPHGIALGGAEVQLTRQEIDHRVGTTPAGTVVVTVRGFAAPPSGEAPGEEYGSEQTRGGEFRSIQHGSLSFLLWLDE